MTVHLDMLAMAAENLLFNCARLTAGNRLLLVVEEGGTHYATSLGPIIAKSARQAGIEPQIITVPFQEVIKEIGTALEEAMAQVDAIIFFARLGDQLRFCGLGQGKRVVVSYALDEEMLASSFGWAHHQAFEGLKHAIDQTIGQAQHIRITCANGTDCTGPGEPSLLQPGADVSVARFPLSVFAPVPATGFSGVIAQVRFLTGTCSRFYRPYGVELEGRLLIEMSEGRIIGFEGSDRDVAAAKAQYNWVAKQFGIDRDAIHSWHVGIHPGCAYSQPAAANFERWCGGAFGNPRLLHFHTCGAYAPGEISLNVVDPTVEIDGVKVWEHGVLYPERVAHGAKALEAFPCARLAFENPAQAIGIDF